MTVLKSGVKIQDSPSSIKVLHFSAERTIFLAQKEDGLKQVIFVHVELGERISRADLVITSPKETIIQNVGRIGAGKSMIEVYVPEVSEPTDYRIVLRWDSNEIGTSVKVTPEKHWVAHIIHHSHLDIGYTDTQPNVLEYHLTYLDQVLELIDLSSEEDFETRFKWIIEVTWPLKHWLKNRPKAMVTKMIRCIQEGLIEVAGGYMSMHTEAYSIDELARTFETAQQLRDEYQLPIDSVLQTDVPGHTKGYLKCLTDMGIKYFCVAHNYAGRSIPHLLPGEKLQRPFYWQQEDGQKVLVWYTDSPHGVYMEGNRLGIADSYQQAFQKLPDLFEQLKDEDFPIEVVHLRVQGAYWDNAGPSTIPAEVAKQWNAKWAYPKLITSTNREFFKHIESLNVTYPTFTGDWSDWWADGIGSAAYENGLNRKAHHMLRYAETLHSVLSMKDEQHEYPTAALEEAYENMVLFDEHTWGAANPWDKSLSHNTSGQIQWDIKGSFARNAYIKAQSEYKRAQHLLMNHLECEFNLPTSSVIVTNPESFEQTDIVTVFVPLGLCNVEKPLKMIDSISREEVAYSIVHQLQSTPKPKGAFITFVAEHVPPIGFRTYQIVEANHREIVKETSSDQDPYVLENDYYCLKFNPESGGITSIFDKDINKELINPNSPFQLNQYIYDTYTTAPRYNHLSSRVTGTSDTLLGKRNTARLAKVKKGKNDAVCQSMKVTLQAAGCEWVEQEIVLYHSIKRIDITNRLMKTATEQKEAVYIAFPFQVEGGKICYEITGDYVSPEDPHVPGSCHYMKAIQHWLSVSNSEFTVFWGTAEAPLIEVGNIHIPYTPFDPTLPSHEPQTVYSYVLNNIWDTNFPNNQGGEMEFHYSITSCEGDFDPVKAAKFGSGVCGPLSGFTVPYFVKNDQGTFVTLDSRNIKVLSVRKIKDAQYSVLLHEIGGQETTTLLRIQGAHIVKAFTANIAGGDRQEIESMLNSCEITLKSGSIQNIIIEI